MDSEAVLRGAQEAQRRVALGLEGQDRVDEVLEGLGPGQRPVLRDVADEDQSPRSPRPLATDIRRTADSRTWPTLPAGPSSSSTVIVWMKSTIVRAGRWALQLGDPADLALGDDPDGPPGGSVEEGQARGPQADLGSS